MSKKNFFLSITLSFLIGHSYSQDFDSNLENNLPMKIANNAVTGGMLNGVPHLYSFTGIDSTKIYKGIGLKAFRYNTVTRQWDTIPDVPDTRGKIAAGASTIDSIIYIVGGYHVDRFGREVSSNKIHRYNINTNAYLTDGANIPVAIDDHVQDVWKDSLLFIITGWSTTGNVPNVQIYNPTTNSWTSGTPTPNNNTYKSFGSSGAIIGNTIYYYGGASGASGFNCQNILRIGTINPTNPSSISWSDTIIDASIYCYRAACLATPSGVNWVGGSAITYNYNGIAYNGSGGVPTTNQNIYYNPSDSTLSRKFIHGDSLPMDLRGVADFGNVKYLVGGMVQNQTVTNKVWKLNYQTVGNTEIRSELTFNAYPNPTFNSITISSNITLPSTLSVYSYSGKLIQSFPISSKKTILDLISFKKGIYFFNMSNSNSSSVKKVVLL